MRILLVLLCFASAQGQSALWQPVDDILNNAVQDGAFPGCVAIVGNQKGYLYAKGIGNFTYGVPPPFNQGQNPPMTLDTIFDMASCTKVIATTTAIAQFYQRGELDLDTRIVDILGSQFGVNGKEDITVRNCLLHNAGFFPDPSPIYSDPAFGCPNTQQYHPAEDFSCQEKIYQSQMAEKLQYPIGSTYSYSDLSFMTLMHVVGTLAMKLGYVQHSDLIASCAQGGPQIDQCYYEAYVRDYVIGFLLSDTGFLPDVSKWSRCAPTDNDTSYHHAVVQGVVEDTNSYADGGISGHAGLFSTAADVFKFMQRWLYATDDEAFINSTTVDLFIKEYNHSQSSRALGWNTNDPNVFDEGWNQSCGSLSPTTFMHTGWTGTMICADPDREVIVILLTNRVYPSDDDWKIKHVRQLFSTAVQSIFDSLPPGYQHSDQTSPDFASDGELLPPR